MLNYNLNQLRLLCELLNEKSEMLDFKAAAMLEQAKTENAMQAPNDEHIEKKFAVILQETARLKKICALLNQCVCILSAAEERANAIDENHYFGEIALRHLSLENLASLMQDIIFE